MPKRVLIVDDEPVIHTTLGFAIPEDEGWDVRGAESAESALEVFVPGELDLIVVDKNLPRTSGVELTKLIRQQDSHVGVVMITGYGSVETAIEMLHLGVDRYIEKPFDDLMAVGAIFERVVDAVRLRRTTDSSAQAIAHFQSAGQALEKAAQRLAPSGRLHAMVVSPVNDEQEWIADVLAEHLTLERCDTSRLLLDRLANSRRPDILLVDSDIKNPGVFELLGEVQRSTAGVSVVVLAEDPSMDAIQRFIELGVRAVVMKPLDREDLLSKLSALMGRA